MWVMGTDDATRPMSLREYARRRGVSAEAVSKAVMTGRLSSCVVRVDGQPKIADPAAADREWDATTRPTAGSAAAAPDAGGSASAYQTSRALREAAAARREAAQADMAELELAERRRQVVDAERARADVIAAFSLVKTRLLGIPSRVAQRRPDLQGDLVELLDEMIREALEELSSGRSAAD
jgi:phage terminase Nu1 subunit (DNA packaging protein)